MKPQELLNQIRLRLRKKLRQAEEGYLNQNMAKITLNCFHRGRPLTDKTHVCKIAAMGDHEGDERAGAHCCWNEKAPICPLFTLKKQQDEIKRDFRLMSPDERRVRWPSLGELLRIETLVRQLDGLEDDSDGEPLRQSVNRQSRSNTTSKNGIPNEHILGDRTSRSGDAEKAEDSKAESRGPNSSGSTTPNSLKT